MCNTRRSRDKMLGQFTSLTLEDIVKCEGNKVSNHSYVDNRKYTKLKQTDPIVEDLLTVEDKEYIKENGIVIKDGKYCMCKHLSIYEYSLIFTIKYELNKTFFQPFNEFLINNPEHPNSIIIRSPHISKIKDKWKELNESFEKAKNKKIPTHVVKLTIIDHSVISKFNAFVHQLSYPRNKSEFPKDLFQKFENLHFTLLTLKANSSMQMRMIQKIFEENVRICLRSIGEIRLELEGLEAMNDDYSKVDVLYMKVRSTDDSERLKKIIELLTNCFSDFVCSDNQKLLHLTLMNSLFLVKNGHNKKRVPFDATNVFKTYGNLSFGKFKFFQICLIKLRYGDVHGCFNIP